MANYSTTSGFSDLIGSMVVTNNNVDSYTSSTLGTVIPDNLGGPGLNFKVKFAGVPRPYHVIATPNANGNGYNGTANNRGPLEAQETWEATASTGTATDEPTADPGYDSGDDAVTKK